MVRHGATKPQGIVPMPLEITDLELWFPGGKTPALTDVNVTLEPETVTAIIGPASVGKSILFKAILTRVAPLPPDGTLPGGMVAQE